MIKSKKQYQINDLNEITLILTEDCNLQCKYCDQIHSKKSQTIENIIEFFNFIKIKNINKPIQIELFGGEPFLERELILEIFKFLRKTLTGPQRNLITFKINTNGTLWNDKYFELLKYLRDNDFNLPNFIISYDGLWQNLRSNDHLTKLIEKNIHDIFSVKCLASIAKISFSYNGEEHQDLLKNYLYIINKFPVSINNIKHYLIREPWKWNEKKFKKFKYDFKEFLKFNLIHLKKYRIHLSYINQKLNEFSNPKLGCGLGKTRITLKQNEILDCGLDNDFRDVKLINSEDIEYNCLSCEIFNYCNKICPKKIFYQNKEGLNYWCEIKKFEFNIIKNFLKNYDKQNYQKIFKGV